MSKLNKNILLATALLPVLVLSACTKQQEQVKTQEQNREEMQEMARVMQEGGSMYCKLSDKETGDVLEYWIKDKKMKAKGLGFAAGVAEEDKAKGVGYMISDAQYTYMWSEGEAEGVKMKLPSEEEMKQMAEDAKEWAEKMPDFSSEEVIEEYEDQGYSVDCKKQNVGDSEFNLPRDVNFKDMSEMMKAVTQMGEKMQENFDEDDLEEMKQMGEQMKQKMGQ